MQAILRQFEAVLNEQDLMSVPQGVEKLIGLYVNRSSSAELRRAICQLLERKAAESSNRALTAYLRAAATCVQQFSDTDKKTRLDEIPKPPVKVLSRESPGGARQATALGAYLASLRPKT